MRHSHSIMNTKIYSVTKLRLLTCSASSTARRAHSLWADGMRYTDNMPCAIALRTSIVPLFIGVMAAMAVSACAGDDGSANESNATVAVTITGVTISGGMSTADDSDGSSSGSDGDGGGGVKLDLGDDTWVPEDACADVVPQPGDDDYSIIWIANTGEHTVSKIDTETAIELARYRTGPGDSDPSRTSVNLRGDVAIGNRSGSVIKIANRTENCIDTNMNGTIDTSSGPDDIREWGEDECVLWYHDLSFSMVAGSQGGPRAIAWDGGAASDCYASAKVWVGWRDQPTANVKIRRIDGVTGETDAEVLAENWECNWGHGTYGGAADKEGHFWGLGTRSNLVHVDAFTLEVERYKGPDVVVYGIALDAEGTPWLGGWDGHLWRFDTDTKEFQDFGAVGASSRMRGLAIDKDGYAWIAGNEPCALVQYDLANSSVVNGNINLPGCGEPVGVSIDRLGMVWVVDRTANQAYKIDPMTYESVIVEGLVAPYTYSDMTGQGLELVVNPPVG